MGIQNKKSKRSLASSSRSSRAIHKPRTRSLLLPASLAGKFVLGVIIFVTILVIFAGLFAFLTSPSRLSKNELNSLAKNYYENYLYANAENPEALARYTNVGLARVSLRQLLLHDPESNPETKNLEKYCDKNETYVKFFPKSPYNKTDYEIEFTYSCNF